MKSDATATITSPWLTLTQAVEYLTGGDRTAQGQRKLSPRFLRRQVQLGRLRAAKIGGQRQLLFKQTWLDEWVESIAKPIEMTPARLRPWKA